MQEAPATTTTSARGTSQTTIFISNDQETAQIFQQAKYLIESAVAIEPFQPSAVINISFPQLSEGRFGPVLACSLSTSEELATTVVRPAKLYVRLAPYLERRRAACVKLIKLPKHSAFNRHRNSILRDHERELQAHSSFHHPRIVHFLGAAPFQEHPIYGDVCGKVMEQANCTLWRYLQVKILSKKTIACLQWIPNI